MNQTPDNNSYMWLHIVIFLSMLLSTVYLISVQ